MKLEPNMANLNRREWMSPATGPDTFEHTVALRGITA
jgi:hypothetical protein